MIVTCASCLTKFQLDDSKVPAEGTKVRCSRCKHVFYVTLPPETKEEVIEKLASFEKYHEELMRPDQKEVEIPSPAEVRGRAMLPKEEETSLFAEKTPAEEVEEEFPIEPSRAGRAEVSISKPRRIVRREKRGPSFFFAILVVLILSIFGLFYLWTESGSGGDPYSILEYPIQKVTELWMRIRGTEKEGLIVRDVNGYDEMKGEIPLFVIEGKVNNQSRLTRRHIKIKMAIFDQNKAKLAEKEILCGRIISREELKNLPDAFFKGEMVIRPKTEKDMVTPPGKTIPFMVVFKNLPASQKEFLVEIVEAPNL